MVSAGGIRAGKAFVELLLRDTNYQKGMRKASERLKSFAAGANKISSRLFLIGGIITAPFIAAIKFAADAEETFSKFNVVFGANAAAMKAWSDDFAASVGRSKREIADFAASTQDLFVPLGFAAEAAEELSKQVTQLTVDLASFNNRADADVMRDLQAALTGSGEVMKKYGVIVDEAAVKQELLSKSIDPATATNAQKAYARLAIIMRGTTAAQGDAIRTAGSFTNQMKRLKAEVEDAAVEIGQKLIPVVTPFVKFAAEAAKEIAAWATRNEEFVLTLAKTGAGILAVAAAVKVLAVAITGAEIAAKGATMLNKYVLVLAAIAAAAWAAKESLDNLKAAQTEATEANIRAGRVERSSGGDFRDRSADVKRTADKQDAELRAKLAADEVEAADKGKDAADAQTEANKALERAWGEASGFTAEQRKAGTALAEAQKREARNRALEQKQEINAAIHDALLSRADLKIRDLESAIDEAREMAVASTRRASMAAEGSSEFAAAIQDWMAPRQDKQIGLLQKQLAEEKRARESLDKLVVMGRNAPQLKVVPL